MAHLLAEFYSQKSCYYSFVKPLYAIQNYTRKKLQIDKKKILKTEYFSEERRIKALKQLTDNLFFEIMGWINYDDHAYFI